MGRRLPSLRPDLQDTSSDEDTRPLIRKLARTWVVVLLWVVVWFPVSALFPDLHAHVPIPPAVMPVFFVLYPTLGTGMGWDHWTAIYLPAAVFWLGLFLLLLTRKALLNWMERHAPWLIHQAQA